MVVDGAKSNLTTYRLVRSRSKYQLSLHLS